MKNYLLPIVFLMILSCEKTEASLPPQEEENSNVSQESSPQTTNVQTQNIIFRDAQGNILTESQKDSIVQNTQGLQALRSFNNNNTEYILFKTFDDLRGFVPDDVIDNLIKEDKIRKSGGQAQVLRQRLLDKWQNQPLPDKKFSLMSGEEKSFSDYLGSTLVVNFWYMNCGPCLIEMPALNQLVEDYKESDINFLSFTFDKKEDLEIFFKNTEFNYIHAPVDLNFMYGFDINVYPTHWIVDETGVIRDLIVGTSLNIYDQLSSLIEKNKK
ncbi:MAG: TlpA disulfide reductase family protein [Candidatus Neomarinimicrobiota bacterium]|nr:TlpA disulfide reductase family protein [Candidatus Neomarinimicrobiota bacterium]